MKVFVFKPSNALIGKFDVDRLDAVAQGLEKFAASNPVGPYDYLECSGKTWTVVTGADGIELQEGRTHHPKSPEAALSDVPSDLAGSLVRRYSDAYTEAHAVVTFGKLIKGIAAFLFIAFVIGGFAMASAGGNNRYGGSEINGLIAGVGFALACLIGIPTYVLGILVAAQGQTALATLDTAVNSSRHLKDDDVARVLSKRFSL